MGNLFQRKDIIYTIAKEQSFSKAAQKLFIAQPSLSLIVKNLEEDLGVPLFDRSSKPIQLTEAGEAYIRATEQIQSIERTFQEYIMALHNVDAGSLRIGSNQLLSTLVLPKFISQFMQIYPNIRLSIMDGNSTSLENAINNGVLDIVIDNSFMPSDIFEQIYLASEYLLLAVPSNFIENANSYALTYQDILEDRHRHITAPVALSTFSQTPFILMNRDNDIRKQTNAIFMQTNFTPRVLFEMDRLTTLYTYVEQGIAATLVSDTLVKNIRGVSQENILFYPLPAPNNKRKIYLSYKRNKYCTNAMRALIQALEGMG